MLSGQATARSTPAPSAPTPNASQQMGSGFDKFGTTYRTQATVDPKRLLSCCVRKGKTNCAILTLRHRVLAGGEREHKANWHVRPSTSHRPLRRDQPTFRSSPALPFTLHEPTHKATITQHVPSIRAECIQSGRGRHDRPACTGQHLWRAVLRNGFRTHVSESRDYAG